MASGVAISDRGIKAFNNKKVHKSSTPEEVKKQKKMVLFCLTEDEKNSVPEENKEILVVYVGQTVDSPYTTFVKMLLDNDCHHALNDALYETKESKKRTWCLSSGSLSVKMIYASFKDTINKKLMGIKHELQANFYEEIKDICTLAEKLKGSTVIFLGKCLCELPPASYLKPLAAPDLPLGVEKFLFPAGL